VTLSPDHSSAGDKEYDEEDVEVFRGDRAVLGGFEGAPPAEIQRPAATAQSASSDPNRFSTDSAPAPVGAYPHARRVGEMLYLSGVGPRQPGTNAIPGGPITDPSGAPRDYDIAAQTAATIENIRKILEAAGSSLEQVVDITVFLVDMERDFTAYNEVYAQYFAEIGPTRTTLAIRALPTPIAVELKVIARVGN
jgi:2-aminomuconate deaminase